MTKHTQRLSAAIVCLSAGLFAPAALSASAETAETPPATIEPLKIASPDGKIEATIVVDGPLTYSVTVDGQPIITDARLGLKLHEGTTLGADVELASSSTRSEDSTWENPLGKRRHRPQSFS